MKENYCQCCGMPMGDTDELYGTNKDNSKNHDYCKYCYDKGCFTYDCTIDEMIESCISHVIDSHPKMKEEEARKMMQAFLPTLKRWRK